MKSLAIFCILFSLAHSVSFPPYAQDFNALFFGDFVCSGSDVEGRLAAQGDVNIFNFGIGCQIYNPTPTQSTCISFGSVTCTEIEAMGKEVFSLVAGQNISAINTQVYAGGIAFGSSFNGGANLVSDCPKQNSSPLNFNEIYSALQNLSVSLSQLTPTGVVNDTYGTLTFVGSGSAVEVFQLDGNVLSHANTLTISSIKSTSTIIVNVNGTSVSFQNAGTGAFQAFQSKTIWNFFEATTLTVSGIAIEGSVLAINADVPNSNGVIWGQIFAKSYVSSNSGGCAQINWIPFAGAQILSTCGNGIVEGSEACDLGSANGNPSTCCSITCQYLPSDDVCRPSAGPCDIPENCTGSAPTCPPDLFLPATTPCGDLFGVCDVQLKAHCPGNSSQCIGAPPAPLWQWDAFNVLSFHTYKCHGGDVQGRLAVRDFADLSGFTLGMEVNGNDYFSLFSLLVAGNANWTDGSIFPNVETTVGEGGYIAVGGVFNAPTYLQNVRLNAFVNTSEFDNAKVYYNTIQNLLAAVPVNAQASILFTHGLQITCTGPSPLYHFQVSSDVFNIVEWYVTVNCSFLAGWIIDITGTGNVQFQGAPFPGVVERVIYNVIGDNARVVSANNGVAGSILAVNGSYNQTGGVTYGILIFGDVIEARQNNKPNCINFQNVTVNNVNLKPVGAGDDFIYVVSIPDYVVGDLVCVSGLCRTVVSGASGNINGNGQVEHVVYVDAPFGQSYPVGTIFATSFSAYEPRNDPIPVVQVYATTNTVNSPTYSSAVSLAISSVLIFIACLF